MRFTIYHPKAPSETRQIIADYEEISSALADGFWTELTDAIAYAAELPERHHFDASGRQRSNLRRFPYHFFSEYSMIISALQLFAITVGVLSSGVADNKS